MSFILSPFSTRHTLRIHPNTIPIISLCIYILVAIITTIFTPINQDEGWYLYASKIVYEGKIPYRDFAYTQTPLLPYVYGILELISLGGVTSGRLLSIFLGLITILVASWISNKLAKKTGITVTITLIACNFFFIQNIIIIKTYALSATLLTCAVAMIIMYDRVPRPLYKDSAILLMLLACMTRLSLVPAFIILLIFFIYRDRSVTTIIAGIASILLIAMPFLLWADEASFNLIFIHMGGYASSTGSPVQILWHMFYRKMQFLSYLSRDFGPLYLILCVSLSIIFTKRHQIRTINGTFLLIGAMWISSFLADVLPSASQSGYQSIWYPVLAIGAAWSVQHASTLTDYGTRQALLVLLAVGLLLTSMHATPSLLAVAGGQPALIRLRNVSEHLKQTNTPGHPILTLDTVVAVDAAQPIVHGTEMSLFSFYGDLPTEKAIELHVVNMELIEKAALNPQVHIVVMSDEAWGRLQNRWVGVVQVGPASWSTGRFKQILEEHYVPTIIDTDFGMPGNTLTMWTRKQRISIQDWPAAGGKLDRQTRRSHIADRQ
jgi:hypothetical protein